jgi:putative restriction endonuclease
MLKAPVRKIGGFGYFKKYHNCSAQEAWDSYGIGNGVSNIDELLQRCTKYVSKNTISTDEVTEFSQIGCIILENFQLLDESEFFDPLEYGEQFAFPSQVVKLKYYDEDFISDVFSENPGSTFSPIDFTLKDTSKIRVSVQRQGQQLFRKKVLKAYSNNCAITGESEKSLLEAAHIQPYLNIESNHIQNGILLRVDIHRLFDMGLIGIDKHYKVRVSSKLSSEHYRILDGNLIVLPENELNFPSVECLDFHFNNVFRK